MNGRAITSTVFLILLTSTSTGVAQETPQDRLQAGIYAEEVQGNLEEAIAIYRSILRDYPENKGVGAKAHLRIGLCLEILGLNDAREAYQRVIEEYPGQAAEVSVARTRLAEMERSTAELSRTSRSASRGSANRATFRRLNFPNRLGWDAQLSPDGENIALGNENKLWIVPMSSNLGPGFPGTPRLLDTPGIKPIHVGFAWSGDGQWIAFNGEPADTAKAGDNTTASIYVIPTEGGEPRKIYETNRDVRVVNYRMSLSPDGDTIAFSSVDGDELHIYAMSVAAGQPRMLVETPAREPVFSPDGKMIAYVENRNMSRGGGGGLWVVSANGGLPKLAADAENASSPVWSPDGTMIAFVDNASADKIQIVEVGPDGSPGGDKTSIDCPEGISEVRRLAGWTPDDVIAAIGAVPIEFALFAQPMDGGKARFLAHGGYPTQPRWSPDVQRIFHVNHTDSTSGDWERLAIAYLPSEGGDVRTVPLQSETKIRLGAYGAGSSVSPDGQTIVFAGHEQGEEGETMHIWTLPVEGGEPRQLTDEPLMDWYPSWSPDGRSIAYVRVTPSENRAGVGKANIFILPANGGEAGRLTSEADGVFPAGPVAWSPDGTYLAYFSRYNEDEDLGTIKIIPADGGEARAVTEVQEIFANKELAWSPDGRRIAFNASPPGPRPSTVRNLIRIVSLDDGSIEEIVPDLENVEAIYHLDWSPDGETLVFGGYMGGGPELWLISDFLPEGR